MLAVFIICKCKLIFFEIRMVQPIMLAIYHVPMNIYLLKKVTRNANINIEIFDDVVVE